jgi:hypothetical protein
LYLELLCDRLSFISANFMSQTLDNFAPRYHEAVGGFFGASQGRPDNTSFEGGNKSGVIAQAR